MADKKLEQYMNKAQAAFTQNQTTREAEKRLPSSSVSESKQKTGMEKLVQGVSDFFGIKQPEPQPKKSVLQRLMEVPVQQKSWYSGETPTASEAYAQIYRIGQKDKATASQLLTQLQAFQQDPSTPFYNPYNQATNRKIADIAAYGVDVSKGINDDFFKNYSWLTNYYSYGSTNSPLGTAKKRSNEQNAAALYYDLLQDEDRTKKAEDEWSALQEEVKYWAGRTDRNLSDEEILARIDWSKYKTLQEMDESRAKGAPIALNRAVGYSRDNLYGVLWEARNGVTGGDASMDAVRYRLGQGTQYRQNNDIQRRWDATNKEYYNPYWTGIASNNMNDTAMYFGVDHFDQDWIDKNAYIMNGNDETAKREYRKVVAAEENTRKAEEEIKTLQERVDSLIKMGCLTPEDILNGILDADEVNDEPALNMLKKIDSSLGKHDMMDTTRALKYSYKDLEREVYRRCEEETLKKSGNAFAYAIAHGFNSMFGQTSANAVRDEQDRNIRNNARAIRDTGTPEEKIVYENARSSTYDQDVAEANNALKNSDVAPQLAVDAAKESAMRYAGQNYLTSRVSLNQRDAQEARRDEITVQLAELAGFEGYKGNIDITNRIPVTNEDGSISTVDSFSIGMTIDGQQKEVLLPTIIDGERVSEDEAIEHFEQTGEHLGIFDTVKEADEYAQRLHEQQEQMYAPKTGAVDRSRIIGPVAAGSPQERPMSMPEAAQEERKKREEQIRLQNELADIETSLAESADEYRNAEELIEKSRDLYQDYVDFATMNNMEVVSEDRFFADFDILAEVLNTPVKLDQSLYSIYDQALMDGRLSKDQMLELAQASLAEMEAAKEEIVNAAKRTNPFIEIPDKDQAANYNMHLEDLDQAIKGAQYFLLRGNADFEKEAGNMLAMINKGLETGVYADKKYTALSEHLTEEEKMTYAYLLKTQKSKAADEYLDYLADDTYGVVTNRKADKNDKERAKYAQENPVVANLISIALSPVKAAGGIYGFYQAMHGKAINTNSKWMQANTYSQIVKNTSHELINKKYGEGTLEAKVLNTMYDVGTSVAESTVNSVISPHLNFAKEGSFLVDLGLKLVSSVAGATVMGLGAAGDTMQEVLDKGGTMDQASAMGFVTLVSETFSEGLSIGNISDAFDRAAKAGGRAGVEILLDLLKSGVEEGSEEVFGELFSTWQEDEIMGKLSERNTLKENYKVQLQADGMSPEEAEEKAKKLADKDLMKQIGQAFLQGSLAGLIGPGAAEIGGTAYQGITNTVSNIQEEAAYNNSRARINEQITQRETATQEANARTAQLEEEKRAAYEQRTAPVPKVIDAANAELAKAEQQTRQAEQAAAEAQQQAEAARQAAAEARATEKEKADGTEEKAQAKAEAERLEQEAKTKDKAAAKAIRQAEKARARENEKAEAYRALNEEAERYNQMDREIEQARLAAEEAAKSEQSLRDFAQAQEDERNEGKALKKAQEQTKKAEAKAKKARERADTKAGTLEEQMIAEDEAHYAEQELADARAEEEKHRENQRRAREVIESKYGELFAEYMDQQLAPQAEAAAEAPTVTIEDIRDQARSHVNRYGIEVNDAEARRTSNDVTALNEASAGNYDNTGKTTAAAAVLADSTPGRMGSTAAQHMADEYGADTMLHGLKKIINNAVNRVGTSLQDIKMAVTVAALNTDGRSHAILSEMMEGSVTTGRIDSMITAAMEEAADPAVSDGLWAKEKENRIAQRAKQIGAQATQPDVEAAKDKVKEAQQKEQSKAETLERARKDYNNVLSYIADLTYRAMELSRDGKSKESVSVGNKRANAYAQQRSLLEQVEKGTRTYMEAQEAVRDAQRKLRDLEQKYTNQYRQQAVAEIEAEDAAQIQAAQQAEAAPVQEGSTTTETAIEPETTQEQAAEQPAVTEQPAEAEQPAETEQPAEQPAEQPSAGPEPNPNDGNRVLFDRLNQMIDDPNAQTGYKITEREIRDMLGDRMTNEVEEFLRRQHQNPRFTEDSSIFTVDLADYLVNNAPTLAGEKGVLAYNDSGDTATATDIRPAHNEEVVSAEHAMLQLEEALGIKGEYRMSKYLRGLRNRTRGYTYNNKVIHVQDIQNAKTAMHEIGHNLDKALDMKGWVEDFKKLEQRYTEKVSKFFLAQYKPYQRPAELMAEFTALWARDRSKAVDLAGEAFVDKFERALRDKGWLKPMQTASEQIRAWETASNMSKAKAMIDLDVAKMTDKMTLNKARSIVADHTLPLQKLTEEDARLHGKVKESRDARTQFLAMPSMVANLTEMNLFGELTDSQGNTVTRKDGTAYGSLSDILNNIKKSEEADWNAYLLARLDIERRKYGKGLYPEGFDSRQAADDFEKAHPHFEKTAEAMYDWYQAFCQTWLVNTGIKSQEEFNLMRRMYPSFVPLHAAEGQRPVSSAQKRTDGNPADVIKGAYKSDVDKYNPVMGLVENVQKYIMTAKQIEALRAFDGQMKSIMRDGGDVGIFAEPAQKTIRVQDYGKANEAALKQLTDVVDVMHFKGEITAEAAESLLERMQELPEQGFMFSKLASGSDVVNIPMADGSVSSWTIYDPQLFKALTMVKPGGRQYRFARAVAGLTRFLSANATSRSLKFSGQNVFSDTETAANTGRTGYDGDLVKDIASGLRPVHMVNELRSMFELLGNMAAEKAWGQKIGLKTSDTYEQFKKFGMPGSRYAFREGKSQQEIRNKLYSGKGTIGKKTPLKTLGKVFRPVEFIGELGETMTRYNAFAHSGFDLSTYDGRLAAGRAQREATVDFSKFGSGADSAAYKGITAVVPFLNAQVQGLDKTVDTLKEIKDDPYRRAVILGRMAVNSILSGALVSGIRGLTWDDDDEAAYAQLTDYEKQKFIHLFRVGNNWVKIKRSQDMFIQAADLIGEFIGEVSTGYEGDALGDLAAGAKEIVKNGMISTGTVIQPVVDALNGKTWYGGDTDTYTEKQMSMTARYGADTSKVARVISELTGGRMSPKAADYAIQQFLGSAGEFGSALFDSVTNTTSNLIDGKNPDFNPMLNWVLDDVVGGYVIDPVYSNKVATTFYTGKTNLDQFIKDSDSGKNEMLNYGLSQDEVNEAYSVAKALTSKGGIIYAASARYSELKKEYEKVMSDDSTMTKAEREQRGREIKAEQNRVLLEANTAMGDFWNKYGYSNPLLQTAMNTLNVFTDSKKIPQEQEDFNAAPYMQSAESAIPEVFKGDMESSYMKQAVAVYESTGNSTALPHPMGDTGTFTDKTIGKTKTSVKYDLKDGNYQLYIDAYVNTYRDYVSKIKKWDTLSDEEKIQKLTTAHNNANTAGKKAWLKDYLGK